MEPLAPPVRRAVSGGESGLLTSFHEINKNLIDTNSVDDGSLAHDGTDVVQYDLEVECYFSTKEATRTIDIFRCDTADLYTQEHHASEDTIPRYLDEGDLGKEEMKIGPHESNRKSRALSTMLSTYDIGQTLCPDIFWGLMTVLTLLGSFVIVVGIIFINVYKISFKGGQDSLKGETVDTTLNILSTSGQAAMLLRPGASWQTAFKIAANAGGFFSIFRGRNSDNEILRLDKEGTLTTVGNADIGGSVLALGFSSGSEGLTFSDGSTMTTAASKLAGTTSDTDLNLVAGAGGGGGAIVMSTGRKERVRVDELGAVYFRGPDTAGGIPPLGSGVTVDGLNGTVSVGKQLTLTAEGVSSPEKIVLESEESIVLGSSTSSVTAVQGSLMFEGDSQVEIGSDKVSFTVSAQSYADSVVTFLPGGSSNVLAALNATSIGDPQLSPATLGLVWNSDDACESGEICIGYAGSTSRWAAVSLALEGVRLDPNAAGGVSTNYTMPPSTERILCSVEGSDGAEVLSVAGGVSVSDEPDYFSGLGLTRHVLLEPGTRYVVRCGTTHSTGGPILSDRVSLSMIAL